MSVDEEEFKRDYENGVVIEKICVKHKISQMQFYYLCGKLGLNLKGKGSRLPFDIITVRPQGNLYLPVKVMKGLGLKRGDKVRAKVESTNPMRVLLEKVEADEG